MRKFMWGAILLFVLAGASFAGKHNPMVGGGLGFASVDDVYFVFSAEGIVPIKNSLCLRASFFNVNAGDVTTINFGNSVVSGIDLLYYFDGVSSGFTPYGFGGLGISSIEDYTMFKFGVGGGAQFDLKGSNLKPYAELGIGMVNTSYDSDYGDASESDFVFGLMFGIRFGK